MVSARSRLNLVISEFSDFSHGRRNRGVHGTPLKYCKYILEMIIKIFLEKISLNIYFFLKKISLHLWILLDTACHESLS